MLEVGRLGGRNVVTIENGKHSWGPVGKVEKRDPRDSIIFFWFCTVGTSWEYGFDPYPNRRIWVRESVQIPLYLNALYLVHSEESW